MRSAVWSDGPCSPGPERPLALHALSFGTSEGESDQPEPILQQRFCKGCCSILRPLIQKLTGSRVSEAVNFPMLIED